MTTTNSHRFFQLLALVLGVISIGLAAVLFLQTVDYAHYRHDQISSWTLMQRELNFLQDLRVEYCSTESPATKERILTKYPDHFEKDGYFWINGVGVAFDDNNIAKSVCLQQISQFAFEQTATEVEENCITQPICGS